MNVTPTVPQEASCCSSTEAVSCCHVPTLLPCVSPVWSAVTTQNGLNEPDPHSRNFPNGTSVVGKIATRAKDDVSLCADGGRDVLLGPLVHAFPVVDALLTTSPCVYIFHVDPSHCRDSVELRVR